MGPAEAFALLEIPPAAAENDIRRAYARRLKSFRPDEDPEGFQRLVEARDIALAHARARTAPHQLRVVYGKWPDHTFSNPPPTDPPPTPGEGPAEPDKPAGSDPGENAAPAAQPEDPPTRQPSPPPEFQKPSAPQPRAPKALGCAQPPSADKSAPDGPSPAATPETTPQPEREAEAPEKDVTPADVHSALHNGLRRLVMEKEPFDVRGLEAMLLELPAGGGRIIGQAAIQEISNVLPALHAGSSFPLPAERSLQQLAVMLTDHFGWHDNDRMLFETLSPAEAGRFEDFLANAHRVHAPGKKTRFARRAWLGQLEYGAGASKPRQERWSSGLGMGLLAVFLFYALALAIGSGSNDRPPRWKRYDSQNWAQQYLMQHPEQLAKSLRLTQPRLAYNVDSDYKTLLAYYKARVTPKDRAPPYFIRVAANSYRSRDMQAEAVSLLDRLIATDELRPHRATLKRYRGEAWLRAYGWLNPAACLRTIHARLPELSPEGEAHVRKELEEALDWASRMRFWRPAAVARLLELAGHLVRQKRAGELATFLGRLKERASEGALLRANLQVEIGTIRRCMLHATRRK